MEKTNEKEIVEVTVRFRGNSKTMTGTGLVIGLVLKGEDAVSTGIVGDLTMHDYVKLQDKITQKIGEGLQNDFKYGKLTMEKSE